MKSDEQVIPTYTKDDTAHEESTMKFWRTYGGLTKRELFAAIAMMNLQNVLLRKSGEKKLEEIRSQDGYRGFNDEYVIAKLSIKQADALIKELEK